MCWLMYSPFCIKALLKTCKLGAIIELTCWCITVYWTIVVRHTVGFTQALRHTLRLYQTRTSNTDISYNMVFFKNLNLGYKLDGSAIVGESWQKIYCIDLLFYVTTLIYHVRKANKEFITKTRCFIKQPFFR